MVRYLSSLSTTAMHSLRMRPLLAPRYVNYRMASTSGSNHNSPPVTATTFTDKASPRDVYERPELLRGLPHASAIPSTPTPQARTVDGAVMDAFDGPSRPRLIYERTGRRDLPPLKVSSGLIKLTCSEQGTIMCVDPEGQISSISAHDIR